MFVKKIMSVHGIEVLVHHEVYVNEEHLHVFRIVGICGNSQHRKTWTVGAVDGPRPKPPTVQELQATLEQFRQEVADEAAWKEHTRLVVNTLE